MSLSIHARFTIDPGLPLFEGHFPGRPILPAVGMIDISLSEIAKHLGKPELMIQTIRSSKFMGFVEPKDEIEIFATSSDSILWDVEWKKNAQSVVKLQLAVFDGEA